MRTIDTQNPNHIMIGLGGTGGKVLKAFRKRIWEEFPNEADRNKLSIGYVYVDSTEEMMSPDDESWRVFGQNAQFTTEEFVYIKEVDLDAILNHPENYPGLRHVIGNNPNLMRQAIGEVGKAAGQKRRAGRILFGANINQYLAAVKRQWEKVKRNDASRCTIHIFTGLAGGTGSGSIIDAIAQLRADPTFGGENMKINVYAMVPERDIPPSLDAGRYRPNGYAALSELSAFNCGAWLPSDVRTGEEHVHINTLSNKQFSLMVYSDINENGTHADSLSNLPKLLSDMVFFNMFTEESEDTSSFKRGLNNENKNEYLIEYNYLTDDTIKKEARTKAVNSFGIKRIVYPEQRIVEHISYTLSNSVFSQMVYNNYKEEFGFVDEPVTKDYRALYIDNQEQMRNWKLTDDFLTLNELILNESNRVKKFEEYWRDILEEVNYADTKYNEDNLEPIPYLIKFAQMAFDEDFRSKGVDKYFRDKCESDTLDSNANGIIESIERNLYSQWYDGIMSLHDLLKISGTLLAYMREKLRHLEGDRMACNEKEEEIQERLKDIKEDYDSLYSIQIHQKKLIFNDYRSYLIDLYREKTMLVAYSFTERLLRRLIAAFEDFNQSIQSFVSEVQKCKEETINQISERNKHQGDLNSLQESIIEVREDEKIIRFEKNILLEQNTMKTLASTLRHQLVESKSFAHFSELTQLLKKTRVFNIVDNVVGNKVREMQNTLRQEDRITGINILQQLHKVLKSDDDINRFARIALEQSGVFIILNNNELNRVNNNNKNPNTEPASINIKNVQVTFPTVEGNDELRDFAERLKAAFNRHFSAGSNQWTIGFNYSNHSMNEITIASIKSLFPIRALSWIPIYKAEYDRLTNNQNRATAMEARLVLHSEGNGSQLPNLMGETILAANEIGPYLFLAAALEMLTEEDNEIYGHGWVWKEKDEFGNSISTYLSKKFTDINMSEELSPEIRANIFRNVNQVINDNTISMARREKIIENIRQLVASTVTKECGNNTSLPRYRLNANDARQAIELVRL